MHPYGGHCQCCVGLIQFGPQSVSQCFGDTHFPYINSTLMPCFSFCLPPCSRWIFVNSSLWSSRTSPFKWFTSQLSSTGEACGQWIGAFGRQAWPHTATDHRCCKYNSAGLLVEHFPLRMLVLSLNLVLFYSVQKNRMKRISSSSAIYGLHW